MLNKVDGIYDIIPLDKPALSNFDIAVIMFLIAITIATLIYLLNKYVLSKKAKARRKIINLQKQHFLNKISTHKSIFKLCSLLQTGLNIHHIGKNIELPNKLEKNKKEWHIFTKKMSVLRYKNLPHSKAEAHDLFNNSLYWLKIWP